MEHKQNNLAAGASIATITATLLVVALTVFGELYSPLKDLLKDAHHHHWVGKGIWAGVCFVVVLLIVLVTSEKSDDAVTKSLRFLSYVLYFALVVLFTFFLYEYQIH